METLCRTNRLPHECVIGMLSRGNDSFLVTLPKLELIAYEDAERNKRIRFDANYELLKGLFPPGYTIKDYADTRKNTGLQHFKFCPNCGTAINWHAIRSLDHTNIP